MPLRSVSRVLSLAPLLAVLAACGGGIDDAIDPYVGGFDGVQCTPSNSVTDTATGAKLFTREVITYARTSPTQASGTSQLQVFSTNACSGTPVATAQSAISLKVLGTVLLGGRLVNQVALHNDGDYFHGNSANPIIVNGVTFAGYSGTHPTTTKNLYYLKGNDLYTGDTKSTPDGSGYPGALLSAPTYRRK